MEHKGVTKDQKELQNMTRMYTMRMTMVLSGRNPMTAIMKMSLLLHMHPTRQDIFSTLNDQEKCTGLCIGSLQGFTEISPIKQAVQDNY
jgi:hypothetical protein